MDTARVSPLEHEKQLSKKFVEFVTTKFNRKECGRFVHKADDSKDSGDGVISRCYCGETKTNHQYHQRRGDDTVDANSKWNCLTDTVKYPTNACGSISFNTQESHKLSKFVRLADDSNVDAVVELLRDHWEMLKPVKPSLVITVIGGAKNFELERKKKEVFERGLIKAAQSTNAWIITAGFNLGVMKAVGEAVSKGQTYNWNNTSLSNTIKCVGIGPWGYVERRSQLETISIEPVKYRVNKTVSHGQPASLNPDHTHFLLVDDGGRGSYQGVGGGVREFRARLERKIMQPKDAPDAKDRGLGIPLVLLLLEGGHDAIDDVYTSLSSGIPVVICDGTGRAANILAYAYKLTTDKKNLRPDRQKQTDAILRCKLIEAFSERWRQNTQAMEEKYFNTVKNCCEKANLITVIDMNKEHDELDVAILSTLLKSQEKATIKQLELALTWNRSDVAEDKIFSQENSWPTGEIEKMMTLALVDNKVDFVRLFLQNGINIQTYLTHEKLLDLYRQTHAKISEGSMFTKLLTKYAGLAPTENYELKHISKLICNLIGKFETEHYRGKKTDSFKRPFLELLYWAVIMNRHQMALFMWECADDPIPAALTASWMYGSLADRTPQYQSDLKDSFNRCKNDFEQRAVQVLEECHRVNAERASILVKKKNEAWSGMNCLEMAAEAKDRAFLSTVCCQNTLNQMWLNGIQSHWMMVLPSVFFPPLIVWLVKFQAVYDEENEETRELSSCQKLIQFYQAPVTKFTTNVVMYILFLVLYSYLILFAFYETIGAIEWVVLGWLFTMLLEEIRDMLFSSSASRWQDRVHEWWIFSIFNRIDALIFIVAIVGFILRWFPQHFIVAKDLYSFNGVILFVRFLREYSANSRLGPKLVMIMKMLEELGLFLLVFAIIVVAYGVTTQALMYPNREPYILIFRDIFYFAYFQLFGQIFLDDMEGFNCVAVNGTSLLTYGYTCPNTNYLVYVFTSVYLMIANILLLNILIAIFNNVFTEIQANSVEIWKYGIYFLVIEYDRKPGLAPPFIIIEHMYLLLKLLFTKLKCCCLQEKDRETKEELDLLLNAFEKERCKYLLQQKSLSENESTQKKIFFIEARVDEIYKLLEEERLLEDQKKSQETNASGYDVQDDSERQKEEKRRRRRRKQRAGSSLNLEQSHAVVLSSNVMQPLPPPQKPCDVRIVDGDYAESVDYFGGGGHHNHHARPLVAFDEQSVAGKIEQLSRCLGAIDDRMSSIENRLSTLDEAARNSLYSMEQMLRAVLLMRDGQ